MAHVNSPEAGKSRNTNKEGPKMARKSQSDANQDQGQLAVADAPPPDAPPVDDPVNVAGDVPTSLPSDVVEPEYAQSLDAEEWAVAFVNYVRSNPGAEYSIQRVGEWFERCLKLGYTEAMKEAGKDGPEATLERPTVKIDETRGVVVIDMGKDKPKMSMGRGQALQFGKNVTAKAQNL